MKSCPDNWLSRSCNAGYQFWQSLTEVNHADCYNTVTLLALIYQLTSSITISRSKLVLLLLKSSNCQAEGGGELAPSNPDYVPAGGNLVVVCCDWIPVCLSGFSLHHHYSSAFTWSESDPKMVWEGGGGRGAIFDRRFLAAPDTMEWWIKWVNRNVGQTLGLSW